MTILRRAPSALLLSLGVLGGSACSNGDGADSPTAPTGGQSNTGTGGAGTASTGGGSLGGSTSTGGQSNVTGGQSATSGGTPSNGGSTNSGGASASGGAATSGGTVTTGGAGPGGAAGSAGAKATGGGVTTSGGAGSTTGGSAGAKATGGTVTTGGSTTSGGAATTGGTTTTGGATSATPLAFPGAQGFGKKATGGRTGTVYHVTNLNDSGAGSFRDAVSTANRIVVFDVGGYIQLATAVSVKSNITIAGQSAPGGGIGFRGGEISFAKAQNIICRFIRVRPGSETASTEDDALSLYLARNVMIDHSSFEFGPWNNIDGVSDDWQNNPVTDITIQDSLIADPTGQQFGAHTESVSSQWAWYRNIFANSHNRNPLAKVNTVFVNNVLYNYSAGYTTHTSTNFKHDIVNNYFIFGPASTGTDNTWFQVDKNQSIYYAGNVKDTNRDGNLDGAATTPYWYQGEGTILSSPWSTETTLNTPLSVASTFRVTASLAGTLPRDPLDALIISQVMTLGKGTTGTGANTVGPDGALYTSQAQTGLANNGYGTIAGGTRPTDTDNDGMPDTWERAMGWDPAVNDAMTKAADGYARVEQYLNWLAAPHATSTAGAAADLDLSAYAAGFAPVSPTYTVSGAQNGSVTLSDGHTARFQPTAGFHGLASFSFTVTGSDGTSYTSQALVMVAP
ncbi:MAG TPA: Ig-like domain-containing protein [Polyangiaceae bacterium]|nr:Ig-like domain-containing protein [Polyangiaceae bacterium]